MKFSKIHVRNEDEKLVVIDFLTKVVKFKFDIQKIADGGHNCHISRTCLSCQLDEKIREFQKYIDSDE